MKNLYIPSTKPEILPLLKDSLTPADAFMAWSIYIHKPQGRPAYAAGMEGARARGSFQTAHPGSASVGPIHITGPATLKKKREALRGIVNLLALANRITAKAAHTALEAIDTAADIQA